MALVSVNCPLVLVGLGQLVATLFVLVAMKRACVNTVTLAELKRTLPLSVAYVSYLFPGIGGYPVCDSSVYVLLQWFTLLFVATGQALVFSRYESLHVNAALAMMLLGTFLNRPSLLFGRATLGDQMGPVKLLYCNTVVGICIVMLFAAATGELRAAYNYPALGGQKLHSGVLALLCMWRHCRSATLALLRLTSPLTFAVVDGMKNVVVAYVGIVLASEFCYEMPLWRFYGIHVTVAGSLFYSYYKKYYSDYHMVKVSGEPFNV
eukprot:Em0005g1335a